MNLHVTNRAKKDIRNKYEFYLLEYNSKSVADQFLVEVENSFVIISEYPNVGVWLKNRLHGLARRYVVFKIYTFRKIIVVYEVREDVVVVQRVIDPKQDYTRLFN